MFESALKFLSNPHKIWENGTFEGRRNVLKLAFRGRIEYTRKEGLRTPKLPLPFKVLGNILSTENEMAHLDEETSNALFTTLEEWNQVLKAEALKGDYEPRL